MKGGDLGRRQRRARLVHDEDPRPGRERLGDLDELLPRHREGATGGIGVEIGPEPGEESLGVAALGTAVDPRQASGAAGDLLAEEDVVGGAEGGNEVELLVDHGHARAEGVEGRADRSLNALDDDPPGVGANGPPEDLHERALPGAVLTEEGEDLTTRKLKPDPGKRLHAGIALGDPLHRKQRR